MRLFKKRKKKLRHNLKGRVQTNESCFVGFGDKEIPCRLREFNWLGVIVDHIDLNLTEELKDNAGEGLRISFKLPREFGTIDVLVKSVLVSRYSDIIEGKEKIQMEFNLEEHQEIELIREFVSYRNRRFTRHQSSRKSLRFVKLSTVLIWFFYVPIAILAVFTILSWIKKQIF